nr:hypothetical protein CFP56_19098 [Quercus suber]
MLATASHTKFIQQQQKQKKTAEEEGAVAVPLPPGLGISSIYSLRAAVYYSISIQSCCLSTNNIGESDMRHHPICAIFICPFWTDCVPDWSFFLSFFCFGLVVVAVFEIYP